jgi:hypothetical protein
MSRILAVAANTFRETVRERVLYNLVFFAILMTLSGLLLGQLSIRQDEKIIKDLGFAAMDLFGTLIAVFIGALMTAGLYLTLVGTGRRPDPLLLAAVYPIFLGLLLVVAFAMLFSTVSSSSALASVFTVGTVVAGRFTDVIRNMRDVAPGVPPWLVDGLYAVLPNFRNLDFKDRVAYGDPVPATVLAWVTVYAVVYVAIVLGLGLAAFRSRDFQ